MNSLVMGPITADLHGLNVDLDLLRTFWHVAHANTISDAVPQIG